MQMQLSADETIISHFSGLKVITFSFVPVLPVETGIYYTIGVSSARSSLEASVRPSQVVARFF